MREERLFPSVLLLRHARPFASRATHILYMSLVHTLNQINKSIVLELKDHISKTGGTKDFIETIEDKLQNIQKPMYNFITAQQEQLVKKLTENAGDKSKQEAIMNELSDFLNKWKNSSTHKGNFGERLKSMIQSPG